MQQFTVGILNISCPLEYWPQYTVDHGKETYCRAYLSWYPSTTPRTPTTPRPEPAEGLETVMNAFSVVAAIVFVGLLVACCAMGGQTREDEVETVVGTQRAEER